MTKEQRRYIGSDGQTYRTLDLGRDDMSPAYPFWLPGNYRSECSACWLGISHSEAKHNASIPLDPNACQDAFDRAAGLL